MNNYYLILLFLFIPMLILANCERQQNESADPSRATDTLAAKKPEIPASLPPNSALISGTVQSVDTAGVEKLQITFKIAAVNQYGPATKPLSENQQLKLTTTFSFLNKEDIEISPGDSLRLVISQTMALNQKKQGSPWRIVDFK